MRVSLPMGKSIITGDVPDDTEIILPKKNNKKTIDGDILLKNALSSPIASRQLGELIGSDESVAILVSDITRPVPTKKLLLHLFTELEHAGVKSRTRIIFGLGLHRLMSEPEKKHILGDYYYQASHLEHELDNCTYLKDTGHGTPVEIFSKVAECDRIICTGNIEFHYYAGYTGGSKALLPGVSSECSIIKNHSLMLDKTSYAGNIDGALRRDIDEAGKIAGIDFIYDVVLDSNKNIIYAVAGDAIKAHRNGTQMVDKLYKIPVEPADVVIVSAGGMPKDINLFQAHKALENVKNASKDGGAIILAATCEEGYGNRVFETWINECRTPQDAITRLQKGFVMGGHKAALIGKLALERELYLVSSNDSTFAERAYFKHASTLQKAVNAAMKSRTRPRVLVVPYGNITLLTKNNI
ncbi:MAG: nickel-dependent lactate racemase [Methanosarcinales archaeon]|nr:MAG: nickel-dependent lactate racemase [Methanosarcinales archaeon]